MWKYEVISEIPKLFLSLENRKIKHEESLCEASGNVYIFIYTGYCGSYTEGKLSSEIRTWYFHNILSDFAQ